MLKVGKAAGATLVESYIGANGAKAYQVHDSLVVSIGDGARLDHVHVRNAALIHFLDEEAVGRVRVRVVCLCRQFAHPLLRGRWIRV